MSRTRVGVSTNITLLEEGSPRNEPRIDVVLLAIISETRNEGVQCVFEAVYDVETNILNVSQNKTFRYETKLIALGSYGKGLVRCNNCEKFDSQCLQASKSIRIKLVHSVTEQPRAAKAKGKEIHFTYEDEHPWVNIPTPVNFVPGNDVGELGIDDDFVYHEAEESPEGEDIDEVDNAVIEEHIEAIDYQATPHLTTQDLTLSAIIQTPDQYPIERQPSLTFSSPVQQHILSPLQHTPSRNNQPVSPATSSVLYQEISVWPLQSRGEAELLRYFIDKVGPHLDTTDYLNHFTTIVPQRAAHCPLLYYAIISTASVHRHLMFDTPDEYSEEYQSRCIRILIRFLDDLEYSPDENFLASIVVLRKCEEMSEDDRMCHLLGSSRVINTIGEVAASGGLGEAAAWLALRQSIYVSLTTNVPLNLDLDRYRASSAFQGLTDHAWANKIVFIFAETLKFSTEAVNPTTCDRWCLLDQATTDWFQSKPDTFNPILENSSATTQESDVAKVFPEIHMLQAPHVLGLIYYHLSRIILATSDPSKCRAGFAALQAWRETESTFRQHLKRIVGLARSNPHVMAANFEASHILYACGHCLSSSTEREAAINFLHGVRQNLGWRIEHIVNHLKRHWQGG